MSGWSHIHIREKKDEEIKSYITEGYPSISEMRTWVENNYKNCLSKLDLVILSQANDTSDSGNASVFEFHNGNLKLVEEIEGYEGANGRDVVGEIRDEYGVSISMHYGSYDGNWNEKVRNSDNGKVEQAVKLLEEAKEILEDV